ncbi:hypothetical protein VPHD51_0156 [Vibrio phage D51]
MDDLIPVLVELFLWFFIIDFAEKGQAAAKILLWIVLLLIVGGFFVFTI